MACSSCQSPLFERFVLEPIHAKGRGEATLLSICDPCRDRWAASPEAYRLCAIVVSLLAEWKERERCEKLAAEEASRIAAAGAIGG